MNKQPLKMQNMFEFKGISMDSAGSIFPLIMYLLTVLL